MVSTGTPEAKETDHNNHPDGSPFEMKVKTEREKSKDSMEMLAYFDKLSDKTREELLSQLCLQGDPRASTASELLLQPKKKRRILKSICQRWTMQATQTNQGYTMSSLRLNAKRHLTGNIWARFPLFSFNRAFNSLLLLARIETLVKLKLFFANKIAALTQSPARRQETR